MPPRKPAKLSDLLAAITYGDDARALAMIAAAPSLAREQADAGATREAAEEFFLEGINHYIYEGDAALHIAAAGYRHDIVAALIAAGADVQARNRRGATPLHYAADGGPGSSTWDPRAQAATVKRLLAGGADVDAVDMGGVTPLHRAARNRCTPAVRALLAGGADVTRKNKSGSTALDLARLTTGRGGSGSAAAKTEQEKIIALLDGSTPARRRR
jgi:hypothetical protein